MNNNMMWLHVIIFCTFQIFPKHSEFIDIRINPTWNLKSYKLCVYDKLSLTSSEVIKWQKYGEDEFSGTRYPPSGDLTISENITLLAFLTIPTKKQIIFEISAIECFEKDIFSTVATYGENIKVEFTNCNGMKKDTVIIEPLNNYESNLYCVNNKLRFFNLSNSHVGEYSVNGETFSLQRLLNRIYITSYNGPIDVVFDLDSLYFDIPLQKENTVKWVVSRTSKAAIRYNDIRKKNGIFLLEDVSADKEFTVKRIGKNTQMDFEIRPQNIQPKLTIQDSDTIDDLKVTCTLDLFEGIELKSIFLQKDGKHLITYSDDKYKVSVPKSDCIYRCQYTCQIIFKYRNVISQTEKIVKYYNIQVIPNVAEPKVLHLEEDENIVLLPNQREPVSSYCMSNTYNTNKELLSVESVIHLQSNSYSGNITVTTGKDCGQIDQQLVFTYVKFPDIEVNRLKNGDGFVEVDSTKIQDLEVSVVSRFRGAIVELKFADNQLDTWKNQIRQNYDPKNPPKLGMRKIRIRMKSAKRAENVYETSKHINIYPYTKLAWNSESYQAYPGQTLMLCSSFSQPFMLWSVKIDSIEYTLRETPSFIKWIKSFECALIEVQSGHKKYTFVQNIRNKLPDQRDFFDININELPFQAEFNNNAETKTVECSLEMNNGFDDSIVNSVNVYPLMDVSLNSVRVGTTKARYQLDSFNSADFVCQVQFTLATGSRYLLHIRRRNEIIDPAPKVLITVSPSKIYETKSMTVICNIAKNQSVGEGHLILFVKNTNIMEESRRKEAVYHSENKIISIEIQRTKKSIDDEYYCMTKTKHQVSFLVRRKIKIANAPVITIKLNPTISINGPVKITCTLNELTPEFTKWDFVAPLKSSVTVEFVSEEYTLTVASLNRDNEGMYQCVYNEPYCPDLKSKPIYLYASTGIRKYSDSNSGITILYYPENSLPVLKNVITSFSSTLFQLDWRMKDSITPLKTVECLPFNINVKPENCSIEFEPSADLISPSTVFSSSMIESNGLISSLLEVKVVQFSRPEISAFENKTYIQKWFQTNIKCVIKGPVHLISWLKLKNNSETILITSRTINTNYSEFEKNELYLTISRSESRNGDFYICRGSTKHGMFNESTLIIEKHTEIFFDITKLVVSVVISSLFGAFIISVVVYFVLNKKKKLHSS